MNASRRIKSDLILLLVAVVWGSGFVAQRVASAQTSAFWINGLRMALAILVLLPFTRFQVRFTRRQLPLILMAGCALFLGGTLQQIGLITTTASNAGFITGLYVVLIPIVLTVFWKKKAPILTWVAALLATVGLGMLSLGGKLTLNKGDILVFLGTIAWAFHVILVGKAVQQMDFIRLQSDSTLWWRYST